MSLVGKIFSVVALVLAVFYIGVTAALVSVQENYRRKLATADAKYKQDTEVKNTEIKGWMYKHSQVTGDNARLQTEKAVLEGENRSLKTEWATSAAVSQFQMGIINDQEEEIRGLVAQRDQIHTEFVEKQKGNDALNQKIAELGDKIKQLEQTRDRLQDLLLVREKDLANAEKEVAKLAEDLSKDNTVLLRLKAAVPEEYDKAVRGSGPVEPKTAIRGKVTAVDKKLGLVIINVGQRHEVRKGYSFIVFRGSQYIGKIIVDEVFPDVSAARYDRESMKGDVEVGDDVTTKLVVDF